MFIIDETVFIHLHKCAGTSIHQMLLLERRNDIKFIVNHRSLKNLPPEYKNYRKIALVRNPLTWYNSFYDYSWRKSKDELQLVEGLLTKDVSFDTFLNRALDFNNFMSPYHRQFRKTLIEDHRPMIQDFYSNAQEIEFENTLYRERFETLGVGGCELFHMETQFQEVMDILKLKTELKRNVSPNLKIPDIEHQNLILKSDDKMFDLLGYKKEMI